MVGVKLLRRWIVPVLCILAMAVAPVNGPAAAKTAPKPPKQQTFDSPDAAVLALREAAAKRDKEALRGILGPGVEDFLSGDTVQDRRDFEAFVTHMTYRTELGPVVNNHVTIYIGDNRWPFAVPLASRNGRWYFDAAAGKQELLARRIGANELDALQVGLAIHLAELEYQSQVRPGNSVRQYAARLISSPGKQNGLYWPATGNEPPSPLGPLVAQAAAEGYGGNVPTGTRTPYRGYFYRLLTKQGPQAPGGARDYLVNGRLLGGFALVAYPAKWGSSGVMTFIMGPQGKVYEKNLGPKTETYARQMQVYNPDPSWKPALPAQPSFVVGYLKPPAQTTLPPEAVVRVYLVDVTNPGEPRVIGKQSISEGGPLPLRFAVEYDPARIKADADYVLAANVLMGGQLRWRQAAPVPVLTKGHARTADVTLAPVLPQPQETAPE